MRSVLMFQVHCHSRAQWRTSWALVLVLCSMDLVAVRLLWLVDGEIGVMLAGKGWVIDESSGSSSESWVRDDA